MWHIIRNNGTPTKYITINETEGRTDQLLRDSNSSCWVPALDYASLDKDNQPELLDDFIESNDYTIIHSFESDNPITYTNSLLKTHPELFI